MHGSCLNHKAPFGRPVFPPKKSLSGSLQANCIKPTATSLSCFIISNMFSPQFCFVREGGSVCMRSAQKIGPREEGISILLRTQIKEPDKNLEFTLLLPFSLFYSHHIPSFPPLISTTSRFPHARQKPSHLLRGRRRTLNLKCTRTQGTATNRPSPRLHIKCQMHHFNTNKSLVRSVWRYM
jgi:hypothetical protein